MKRLLAPFGLLSFFGFFFFSYASTAKEDPYWLTLLHYKKNISGGYKSLIDDKKFFVTKNGKYEPKKEMEASIKLIREAPLKFACKFPLRYEYLNSKYNLSEFNISSCVKLQKFLGKIEPKKAVLVFADADINKPASMFGHTFIRIDTKENMPILSSAVNYAAYVTDTNGILFAFKGIFGFYKAYYSLMPYYDKLKEYSDKDNRDLWEYSLNLTKPEVRKMVLHIWELKDIYSDYYFFSENCSYNILFLIEAANPDIKITDDYFLAVVPLDTVKNLKQNGIIDKYSYRPSLVKEIETISKPIKNKKLIVNIAKGKTSPKEVLLLKISNEKKARVLDSAVRYLEYISKKIKIDKQTYTKRFLSILKARSKVDYISNYSYKVPFNPVNSHNSKRLSLSYGKFDSKDYVDVGIRLAYHTLDDIIQGYKIGSSLAFGDFRFRYKDNSLKANKIGLIEIESLSKRDEFFKPVSWKVNLGFYTRYVNTQEEKLVFSINPGGGLTYKLGNSLVFSMLNTELNIHSSFKKGYLFGGGLEIGDAMYTGNHILIARAGILRYFLDDIHNKKYLSLKYRYSLNTQNSIGISYRYTDEFRILHDIRVGLYHYF